MRSASLVALALAGLLTISIAHGNERVAPTAKAAATPDAEASPDDDDKLVCKYEKQLGSHMKTRVCLTVAERRRQQEQAQKLMADRVVCGSGCSR